MTIERDRPDCFSDFIRLNELWITEHFQIEEADRQLSADPGRVLREGGHIFSAIVDGIVVGVAALFRDGPDQFELARMAVEPAYRGQGIGRALALAALQHARGERATSVSLGSNTKLAPAIALYRSLGFTVVREEPHPEYARCNI
ncbi:MAG TPA: GNAT family N-acetyltransferase, partial [Rhodothermales bacterium]|nr:GNAT family N-acetyltransferase [Rhodothermales bacterium]